MGECGNQHVFVGAFNATVAAWNFSRVQCLSLLFRIQTHSQSQSHAHAHAQIATRGAHNSSVPENTFQLGDICAIAFYCRNRPHTYLPMLREATDSQPNWPTSYLCIYLFIYMQEYYCTTYVQGERTRGARKPAQSPNGK